MKSDEPERRNRNEQFAIEEIKARFQASTTWLYPLAACGVVEILYTISIFTKVPESAFLTFGVVRLGIFLWAFYRLIPAWKNARKFDGVQIHAILGTMIFVAIVIPVIWAFMAPQAQG